MPQSVLLLTLSAVFLLFPKNSTSTSPPHPPPAVINGADINIGTGFSKCVDISNWNYRNGVELQQWACGNAATNQMFKVRRITEFTAVARHLCISLN